MTRPIVRKCFGSICLFNCDGRWCDADEIELDEYGNCKTFIDKTVYTEVKEFSDGSRTCV